MSRRLLWASALWATMSAMWAAAADEPAPEKAAASATEDVKPAAETASDPMLGTLKGTITFDGDPPVPDVLARVPAFGVVNDESLLVDAETGGLANVFIYLSKVPADVEIPAPPKAAAAVQIKATLHVPRVMAVRVGQPVSLKNADPIGHTVRNSPLRNPQINKLIGAAAIVELTYDKPEKSPLQLSDDLSPWVKAYHVVLDHPYVAITDAKGRFKIDKLPPGNHTFRIWHERAGFLDRNFPAMINAGEITDVSGSYPADKFK